MEDAHATILNLHSLPEDDHFDEPILEDEEEDEEHDSEDNVNKDVPDTDTTNASDHTAFFGVYDGHGGRKAAIFTGKFLHKIVKNTEEFKKKDYVNALKEGFLACDRAILDNKYMKYDDSGCATTTAIVTPTQIICANAGDSRTIMSINGYAKALSYDHKPSNEGEKARICSAGGYVDMGRVNGNLALSRGIGDFEFKRNNTLPAEEQIVTCYPDVIEHNLNYDSDEFLVLACDGIWDCLTSQKCIECIRLKLYEGYKLPEICEMIIDLCFAPSTGGTGIGCDNMSIVIVALLDQKNGETIDDWYAKMKKRGEESIKLDDERKQKVEKDGAEEVGPASLGPLSEDFESLYKNMYGERYEYGKVGAGDERGDSEGYGEVVGHADEDNQQDDDDLFGGPGNPSLVTLKKLLDTNAVTNDNGVIYLDTSSAEAMLLQLRKNGMEGMIGEDDEEEHEDEKIEDVTKEE